MDKKSKKNETFILTWVAIGGGSFSFFGEARMFSIALAVTKFFAL
jgi:hypothetical protein